jgi:hypothetical protein
MRFVELVRCLVLLVCLAAPANAQIPTYGADQVKARQDAQLLGDRERKGGWLDFDTDFTHQSEFAASSQARALLVEIEIRQRQLGDPLRWVQDGDASDHLKRIIDRISKAKAEGGCTGGSGVPVGCYTNLVAVREGAFIVALILNRHSTTVAWKPDAKSAALALFNNPSWNQNVTNLGNSELFLTGMRLLGGGALFSGAHFDNALFERGRGEFYFMRDHSLHRGLAEPMAPHYAGLVLSQLAALTNIADPGVSQVARNLLQLSLLVPAHLYLPGGGLGMPQEREKAGAITDPDPSDDSHLIPQLNLLVNDPELIGAGHEPYALATPFVLPEVIRSIYLDKGPGGYTFRYKGLSPHTPSTMYPGLKGYPFGWVGFEGNAPTNILVNPWQVAVLPGGGAQLGVMYGSASTKAPSFGVYARSVDPQPGNPVGFSILVHHQPRDIRGVTFDGTPFLPLVEDPEWHGERHAPYRRMMYGRTALTLFDASYTATSKEDPDLKYTMVHLPQFDGPTGVTRCANSDWFVGEAGDPNDPERAYVAYLPLADVRSETPKSDSWSGEWTYLELGNSTSLITGNITEIANSRVSLRSESRS